MSPNPSTEEEDASETLDLNAEAVAVEDPEPLTSSVQEEVQPESAEDVATKLSVGFSASLPEGSGGEETEASEEGKREINVVQEGGTEGTAGLASGVVTDGSMSLKVALDLGGQVVKGEGAENFDSVVGVSLEVGTGVEAPEKGDVFMADLNSDAVVSVVETQSEGTCVSVSLEVGPRVEALGKGDVFMADLNSDVAVLVVETRREGTRVVDEAQLAKGDAIVENLRPVTEVSFTSQPWPREDEDVVSGALPCEDCSIPSQVLSIEAEQIPSQAEISTDLVLGSSSPVAQVASISQPPEDQTVGSETLPSEVEASLPETSQPFLDHSVASQARPSEAVHAPSQVQTPTCLVLGSSPPVAEVSSNSLPLEVPPRDIEASLSETSQLPEDHNIASQVPPGQVEHVPSQVEISAGPVVGSSLPVAEVSSFSQPTDDQNVRSEAHPSEAEVSLPGTACLSQDHSTASQLLPSEVEHVSSSGPVLGKNQNAEAHPVVSHHEKNQESQPSKRAGLDTSPSGGTTVGKESEVVEGDALQSEDSHAREVKMDKEEVDGEVTVAGCSVENHASELDTVGDQQAEGDALELSKKVEKPSVKRAIISPVLRACYDLPREEKSKFSVSDLVWGKVKSHPWWPGQIFDPMDASELALKHQRKDNFLVAYFGDRTFAWCEESQLNLFRKYFSQMEKQSVSDVFLNAVNSALDEVSRRVEFGMSCSCVPEQSFKILKDQKFENAGVREGADCSVVDKSLGATSFRPDKFLQYVKALAQSPYGGADRLELAIARAQLMAFSRSRGYTELPAFCVGAGLSEKGTAVSPSERKRARKASVEHLTPTSTDIEVSSVLSDLISGKGKQKVEGSSRHKQKHIFGDGRKQKSLSELMEFEKDSSSVNGNGSGSEVTVAGNLFSHSSGEKRKGIDSISALSGKSKKKRLDALGDLEIKSLSPTLKKSFMIGERILRVATKLSGSPSVDKCNGESFKESAGKADQDSPFGFDASLHASKETQRKKADMLKDCSSSEEMLSQLCLAARHPLKGHSLSSELISIFEDIRKYQCSSSAQNEVLSEKIGGKRGRKKLADSKADFMEMSIMDSSSAKDDKSLEIRSKRARKKSSKLADFSGTFTLDASAARDAKSLEIGSKRGRRGRKKSSISKVDLAEKSMLDSPFAKDKKASDKIGRKRGRKKKSNSKSDSAETSTVDYMKDSYWTDRIVCSSSEGKTHSRGRKRKTESPMQSPTKKANTTVKPIESLPLSKMLETAHHLRISAVSPTANRDLAVEKQVNFFGKKCAGSTPTELILSFTESESLPSETDLFRIFSRYGPLKEAETEVLKKTNCAKVVFKRRADAEVAFSSTGKYSIFGPALVSYRLRYLPSPKTSPHATPDSKMDTTMEESNVEDPETKG